MLRLDKIKVFVGFHYFRVVATGFSDVPTTSMYVKRITTMMISSSKKNFKTTNLPDPKMEIPELEE